MLAATTMSRNCGLHATSGMVLAVIISFCVMSAGCLSDDTPQPAPPGGNGGEPGVLIQTMGDVSGQGVILAGVPRGTIDTLTFTIALAPGVTSLDLSSMTVIYADAVRTEVLTPVAGFRGNPPQGFWGIVAAPGELGNPNMRLDYSEEFTIRINPRAPVVPNQIITVSIKPYEGKPLIFRRVAPSSIREDDNVLAPL